MAGEPASRGSAAEAKAIQSLLKLDAQNVLTDDNATEARLREPHGPRILHVATHAFFLADPQASGARCPDAAVSPRRESAAAVGPSALRRQRPALGEPTTMEYSPPPRRPSLTCPAPSWPCSRPARRAWGRCSRARECTVCLERWCWQERRRSLSPCGRWATTPPRSSWRTITAASSKAKVARGHCAPRAGDGGQSSTPAPLLLGRVHSHRRLETAGGP
jgi:hypothetical protein